MDKFGGIKENVEVVRSFDWWTVVIGVLIAIGIVMLYTEYERVLEENGLENGKVDSSMQFVRNKYLELMEKSFKQ